MIIFPELSFANYMSFYYCMGRFDATPQLYVNLVSMDTIFSTKFSTSSAVSTHIHIKIGRNCFKIVLVPVDLIPIFRYSCSEFQNFQVLLENL